MSRSLVVELCTEEIPPKALRSLGQAFARALVDELRSKGIVGSDTPFIPFASPRRLGVHIAGVLHKAADREVSHKLVPVKVGLDAGGKPTQPLLKKLAALGMDSRTIDDLRREKDDKNEFLVLDVKEPGQPISALLQVALNKAIACLPIPKVMSYQLADGWTTTHFVRPVHHLLALYGSDILEVSALGLQAGRKTLGHRFEALHNPIEVRDADSYSRQLEEDGAVLAHFAERRTEIARQLAAVAANIPGRPTPIDDSDLLDEVTGLVERPNVVQATFDEQFLDVPPECLILTMKANQRYFPLLKSDGSLSNHFLIVANVTPPDPKEVIAGNERVLRARLADARFFFDQDRKVSLASRLPKLAQVVYHTKLGSQAQRVERIVTITRGIAAQLGDGAFAALAEQTATLAKADLLTQMVGEFPELQGTMGAHYARHEGLSEEIAQAIEDHYRPRFATDDLPRNRVAVVVALADKLEGLVGLFGIGQVPTGDRDPFALRRSALGLLRILMERNLPLNIDQLIGLAVSVFADLIQDPSAELLDYLYERLTYRLREQTYSPEEVAAVLARRPNRLGDVLMRLDAVQAFSKLPEAADLAGTNKRVSNILTKAGDDLSDTPVNTALFESDAERGLFDALGTIAAQADAAFADGDYQRSLLALANLKTPIDKFFDEVLVNTTDELVRKNRLALLSRFLETMNRIADLSKLST